MLFTDLIDIQHAYIILCNRHDDPHQEQDAEVDEDGVRGQKKMLCLELNTFDPTYFDFIEIASKMSKWEPKYHNGVSQTLKVTAPFLIGAILFFWLLRTPCKVSKSQLGRDC